MENEIYKGAAANDKTGTPARQAADIINGNFAILEQRIVTLENPDEVLKTGVVEIVDLAGSIIDSAFEWRLGGALFLSPGEFNFNLDAAADDNYRVDALLGNNAGGYNIFKGPESDSVVVPPTVFPGGTILLGYIYLFGSAVQSIVPISENAVLNPYTSFKPIQKGFGNTNLDINEIGDIFCGWSNDGTIRFAEAKWLGGSLADSNNFTPLVQVEI